ncbi:hypothetical protein A5727_09575 [Mycobacterium sp. ACS4331]|nr:hypothetical protein A5727_09575 [Mycobacterium sp. ACS4331]
MRFAAITVAVAALGVLTSAGTASADESARDVIDDLRSQGYNVIVDRVGSGNLDNCVVTGVRNPQSISRMPLGDERDDMDLTGTVTLRQTITVSLNCGG